MLFHAFKKTFTDPEEAGPSIQTSAEGPGKCFNAMKIMCECYSCIFYLIPTKNTLKMLLNIKIPFTLDVSFKFSNVIMS